MSSLETRTNQGESCPSLFELSLRIQSGFIGAQYEQNRVVSTRIGHAYILLGIVFEFDQWFTARICHAIGNPHNADDFDGEC